MKKDCKVRVIEGAPFHAGRIGYFQFEGTGASSGVAVLVQDLKPDAYGESVFFAVAITDIVPV